MRFNLKLVKIIIFLMLIHFLIVFYAGAPFESDEDDKNSSGSQKDRGEVVHPLGDPPLDLPQGVADEV